MFKSPPKRPEKRPQQQSTDYRLSGVDTLNKLEPPLRMEPIRTNGVAASENKTKNVQIYHQTSKKHRRRTADDFLLFCKFILEYTNYDQMRQQDLRRRHSSSPSLGSTGSGNESVSRSTTSGGNDLEEEDSVDSDDQPANLRRRLGKSENRNRKSQTPKHFKGDGNGSKNTEDDDDLDDEDGEREEDWDQVTCYCGRPFAGRPMIECSHCLTWVHLRCAKLTRQRIPEVWFCQKCKSQKNDKLRDSQTSSKGSQERKASPEVEKLTGSRKRKSSIIRRQSSEVDSHASTAKTRRLSFSDV